jgi:hypothetical protein
VGVGQALLTEDSYGRLSLAINQGSAVQAIGIREDAEVLVTRQQLPRVDEGMQVMEPVAAPAVAAWAGEPAPQWAPGPGGPTPELGWGPPPDAGWGPPPESPPAWGPPPEGAGPWGPPPPADGTASWDPPPPPEPRPGE